MANKIQILRNSKIAETRSDATNTLKTQLAKLSDGEIAIARYEEGEEGKKEVKVLLGFSYKSESATNAIPYIFDADAVPADVQAEITKLIGTDTDTSESVTIKGAKKYADALVGALDVSDSIAENSFVASVSEADGKISVTKGAVTSTNGTVTITAKKDAEEKLTGELSLDVNIDGKTIVKDADDSNKLKVNIDGTTIVKNSSTGVLSVASSALTQYVGSGAIAVSEASTDNNKTISLGINTNDMVLSQSTSGLLASLSLNYSSNEKKITLVGKNSHVISTISTNDFVKDGMLNDAKAFLATGTSQEVQFKGGKHKFENLTKDNHYIGFEFKTSDGTSIGTSYTYDSLDATTIIDVYTAGNGLVLSDHEFSVKKSVDSESFLSVSSDGVKVSGVQTAITNAITNAINALDVTAVGGTGKVITTVSETDGKISATEIDLKAVNVAATETAATDVKVAVEGTTVEAQIASLATSIAKIDCGTY